MITVCLTSNKYHPVLVPFAHYWNRFAGVDHDVTVACYDAPLPPLPPNFNAIRIGEQTKYDWSGGLEYLLDAILLKETFILLLLEDYFLSDPVDWDRVNEAQAKMEADDNIGKFDMTDDRRKLDHHQVGENMILSDAGTRFQTSLQAAIWRTDILYQLLRIGESPWQFEKLGTDRWIEKRRSAEWAWRQDPGNLIYGFIDPPMWYANAVGGAGDKPGVIEGKRMPDWMKVECKEKGWLST